MDRHELYKRCEQFAKLANSQIVAPTWGGRDLSRAEQNAVARVQKATNISTDEAITFVLGVGTDAIFHMSFDEIRATLGKSNKEIADEREGSGGSYYDSAEGLTISKRRALHELKRHGQGEEAIAEFLADLGDRETYDAQEVLHWLGY